MTSDLTYGVFNTTSYNSLKGLQLNNGSNDEVSEVIIVPASIHTNDGSKSGMIAVYCKSDKFNNYSSVRLNYLD